MKQVIRRGLKEIIVDDLADPGLLPFHVLIRTHYSLISSGTETAGIHQENLLKEVAENPGHLQKIWGAMKGAGPIRTLSEVQAKFSEYAVLGYSGAGIIVDKDPRITDVQVGDRVAYGGEGTGHAETVRTGRYLVARVPDSVQLEHACFATLGSIALNAVRIARIGIGDVVVVIGQGLVGQLSSQLARLAGAVVVATDLRADRLDLAKKLGAAHVLPADGALTESVNEITNGRGADCVIVAAAAKSAVPCQQAVAVCRDRGRIVVVGAVDMSLDWSSMYMKEISMSMARAYGPGSYDSTYERQGQDYPLPYVRWTENRNMEEFLRLVEQGQVLVHPLITHVFPLEGAPEAYQTIMEGSSGSLGVLLRYGATEQKPETAFTPKHRIEVTERRDGSTRVALVGAGNLARWAHLPNLQKIPGVTLRAIYSANSVRGKSYARRFGAHYNCTSYEEILNDPEIDAVVIASRNQDHARQAVAALRAGKHVFVEKPMALTEPECHDLCTAVQESDRVLTVGFNRRFAPFYAELKRHLKRRTGPAVLNCRVNSPGISGPYWMADPSIGGAILGEACHFVDLMYWLLESEPALVSAYCLPVGKKDPVGENNLVASFRFADGSIANLTYCTVGTKKSSGERVEAFAQGISVVTADFKKLWVSSGIVRKKTKIWADKGLAEEMASFISSIRGEAPPTVTVRDGVRSTIACLRMLDSARDQKPFPIHLSSFC
jgi:predicted dehydrogenase/threonine dehydrogenase-like Zn-dependent dehydrogenase